MSWLQLGTALAGGLLGAKESKKGTTSTSENKLDPRLDRYVYGEDGKSGLAGSAYGLMQDQLKNGGLNDLQRQGMEMQRQYLMSPQYQQGFGNMSSLGQSLMGGGVAANPFTGGSNVKGSAPASRFAYSGEQAAQLPSYAMQTGLLAPAAQPGQQGLAGLAGDGRDVDNSGGGAYGGAWSGGLPALDPQIAAMLGLPGLTYSALQSLGLGTPTAAQINARSASRLARQEGAGGGYGSAGDSFGGDGGFGAGDYGDGTGR